MAKRTPPKIAKPKLPQVPSSQPVRERGLTHELIKDYEDKSHTTPSADDERGDIQRLDD